MSHDHDHAHEPRPSIDHRAVVARESERFIDVISAGPLEAEVPGCPGWTLRELAVHQGDVWRWAATVMQTGGEDPAEYAPDEAEDLVAWLREGAALVLAAIDATDPEAPCWNLWKTADKTMGFWHRRQANEVSVHRWDAESAVGATTPFEAAIAADIVDEWVHVMLPRAIERDGRDISLLTGDAHLHCTDTPGEWTFEMVDGAVVVSNEHRKSTVAARGPAADLALLVFNRGDRHGVDIFGDTELLDRWIG